MRSISRVADVSINTVSKLLVEAGEACSPSTMRRSATSSPSASSATKFGRSATPRTRTSRTAKAAPEGAGDVWTWTAIDADTKLIVSYFVGDRGRESAIAFMDDLRDARRKARRS